MGLSLNCQLIAPYDRWSPIISQVSSGTPGQTSATITWTTDEPADSQVEYGETSAYGSSTALSASLVTSHSMEVSGLDPLTTYHFRVISKDANGNPVVSPDATFLTQSTSSEYEIGWNEITDTLIRDVAPANESIPYNYNFHSNVSALIAAWNGAVYDELHDWLLVLGGGDQDYYGNEVYAYRIASKDVVRLTDPSPSTTFTGSAPPYASTASKYTDGMINPRHTDAGLAWLPAPYNVLMEFGGIKSGNPATMGDIWWFDPANVQTPYPSSPIGHNVWQEKTVQGDLYTVNVFPSGTISYGFPAALVACAWDTTRHLLWFQQTAYDCSLFSYDPATPTELTRHIRFGPAVNWWVNAVHHPVLQRFIVMGGGYFKVFDTATSPATLLSVTPTGGTDLIAAKGPGLAYDPISGNIVGWCGGNTVYFLDCLTWTFTTQTHLGGPVAASGGTWGRFRYVPSIDGFVTVNSVDANFNILKTRTTDTQPLYAPSLQDERDAYTSWGWTFQASDEITYPADTAYFVPTAGGGTIYPHADTDADDIWENLQMYIHTGQPGFLDRAREWMEFYRDHYTVAIANVEANESTRCHRYGWGLLEWYLMTGDTACLTRAEEYAADIDSYWRSNGIAGAWPTHVQFNLIGWQGNRPGSRQLMLATRLAKITGDSQWVDLRDNLINAYLTTPAWDAAKGAYWINDNPAIYTQYGLSYAAGDRITMSLGDGMLANAFWEVYRDTGNTAIRSRIIAMADFYMTHGINPTYDYGALYLGEYANGSGWWNSPGTIGWATIHHINLLVYAYKLTGTTAYLTEAQHCFDRGTKAYYNDATSRYATPTTPHKFVNAFYSSGMVAFTTGPSSVGSTFTIVKGTMQYANYLFENGGQPIVTG